MTANPPATNLMTRHQRPVPLPLTHSNATNAATHTFWDLLAEWLAPLLRLE